MKISFCVLDWQRWHFNCHCKWCLMYQYPIWMCCVNILVFQKCNKYFYINATLGNFFFFLGLHLCFYFFFPFIFISWRLITLQYCSGFAIHWHESAMDLHVFPILIPSDQLFWSSTLNHFRPFFLLCPLFTCDCHIFILILTH